MFVAALGDLQIGVMSARGDDSVRVDLRKSVDIAVFLKMLACRSFVKSFDNIAVRRCAKYGVPLRGFPV